MKLGIEFSDGRVGASAEGSTPTPVSPPFTIRRRKRSSGGDPGQGSLFG
jgi:hypothetical protein